MYFVNPFSCNRLRAHQNFRRQLGKIFIQTQVLRIDQWRFFSPAVVARASYLFTVVGTARCAVRAACSGASTWPSQRGARSVPPAARGRGRRSAASLPANYVRTVNRYRALAHGGQPEGLPDISRGLSVSDTPGTPSKPNRTLEGCQNCPLLEWHILRTPVSSTILNRFRFRSTIGALRLSRLGIVEFWHPSEGAGD